MTDLSNHFPLLVDDEFDLIRRLVPLAGAELLDIGWAPPRSALASPATAPPAR